MSFPCSTTIFLGRWVALHLDEGRAAIVLRFYEDLSDVQTAAILNCSPGTVRSLISRGMSTLRQTLEGMPR